MPAPQISVILATFNNGPFLGAAIDSILVQTFGDFELLVMDDGSTDNTAGILLELARRDSRIRLFSNARNAGLIPSLNMLLDNVRGEFVARMDGDDIALPRRFEHQIALMGSDGPDACGTWMTTLGDLRQRVIRYPCSDTAIRARMLFQNPFSHPTMMFRRRLFDHGLRYQKHALHAEDYDLYTRLPADCVLANIPEVLYKYRKHAGQVSVTGTIEQWKTAARVRTEHLQRMAIPATSVEQDMHALVRHPSFPASRAEIDGLECWLLKLAGHFSAQPHFLRAIGEQWFFIAIRSGAYGMWAWRKYRNSPLRALFEPSASQKAQLLAICASRLRYRSGIYNFLEQFSG